MHACRLQFRPAGATKSTNSWCGAGQAGRQERSEEIDAVAPVIGKAFDQPSGLQILRHVPERLEREAPSLERPRVKNVAAAAGKVTGDLDLLHAALSPEPPAVVQAVAAGEAQTFMAREISGSRRYPARREI